MRKFSSTPKNKHTLIVLSGVLLATFLLALVSGSLFFSLGKTSADNIDIIASIDSVIAMTTNVPTGTLAIPITPTDSGALGKNELQIRISTNNQTGYTLTMNSETNTTALAHLTESATIPSTTSPIATPTSLPTNTWGWVKGAASATTTFSLIPPLSTPHNITITDAPNTSDTTTLTFAANVDYTQTSGDYANTLVFSATTNYVAPFIPLMQHFTAAKCDAMAVNTAIELRDARDDNNYRVRKMLDNKCWMIDNLAYAGGGNDAYGDVVPIGSGTGNITFANATDYSAWNTTTGLTERYMTTNNFTGADLPDRNGNNIQTTTAQVAGGGQCTNAPTGVGVMQSECLSYLYNWCAAIGLDSGTNPTCAAVEPTTTGTNMTTSGVVGASSTSGGVGGESKGSGGTSICPTGWRLPVGRVGESDDTLNEFAILNASMNSGVYNPTPSTGSGVGYRENWQPAGAFSIIGSGLFIAPVALYMQADRGDYWSSSLPSTTGAAGLEAYSSAVIAGTGSFTRQYGMAVRCVL